MSSRASRRSRPCPWLSETGEAAAVAQQFGDLLSKDSRCRRLPFAADQSAGAEIPRDVLICAMTKGAGDVENDVDNDGWQRLPPRRRFQHRWLRCLRRSGQLHYLDLGRERDQLGSGGACFLPVPRICSVFPVFRRHKVLPDIRSRLTIQFLRSVQWKEVEPDQARGVRLLNGYAGCGGFLLVVQGEAEFGSADIHDVPEGRGDRNVVGEKLNQTQLTLARTPPAVMPAIRQPSTHQLSKLCHLPPPSSPPHTSRQRAGKRGVTTKGVFVVREIIIFCNGNFVGVDDGEAITVIELFKGYAAVSTITSSLELGAPTDRSLQSSTSMSLKATNMPLSPAASAKSERITLKRASIWGTPTPQGDHIIMIPKDDTVELSGKVRFHKQGRSMHTSPTGASTCSGMFVMTKRTKVGITSLGATRWDELRSSDEPDRKERNITPKALSTHLRMQSHDTTMNVPNQIGGRL
ncbi:hypothetical protein BDK51DRAFT_46510 [Blyttiomyces helicus]|uniref:Uncharacterized protein n=1 Tax=Blyttiomyces helicus TaxID=388810 RepID=A0A4P9WPT9_9FUNG|nr:hypothetical protein BDK51DRAFT_46510 [Blyttiomyces helicus]|eukprot:RKO94355.1 hypothetical protein BDK51DRAFT_46510 [Blyttiomyces helicus]